MEHADGNAKLRKNIFQYRATKFEKKKEEKPHFSTFKFCLPTIMNCIFLGGITNTENKVSWPAKSQNDFDNFGLKEPVLAPTINTIPNNGNGIVSILPAPPQVISKYNVEQHQQQQQRTPAKNTKSARLPRNYFSPSVPDTSTKFIPNSQQQNHQHHHSNSNNKIVPAGLINSVATSNQHHSITNNNNKIVPAALINSVATSNQHHSITNHNNKI